MQLGLSLPQYGPSGDPAGVTKFARGAEEMGYDSLWVGDRLLTPVKPSDLYPAEPKPYPPEFTHAPDPLIVWAAAAAATSTIRLGSSTLNGPWYNPVLLVRALTTLDVLSAGRLDVGLGSSWMRDEYTAAEVEWSSRGRRLEEMLDLFQAWWTQNPVEFHGEFFDVPASVVDLRPVQAGGPPIFLGGATPAALARLGRRADGYLMLPGIPDEVVAQLWDVARRSAEAAGRDPDALRRISRLNVHDRDMAKLRPAIAAGREAGYDTTFFDLTYCASSVDDALSLAHELLSGAA